MAAVKREYVLNVFCFVKYFSISVCILWSVHV